MSNGMVFGVTMTGMNLRLMDVRNITKPELAGCRPIIQKIYFKISVEKFQGLKTSRVRRS